MKFLAILPAAALAATPAFAGPYVNIEVNSGFTGSDYGGTVIDNHIGYEGSNWYIQGGPSIVSPDGGNSEVELSGKVGGSVPLTEKLGAYGELSFATGNSDNSYGTKVGVKYSF